MQECPILKRNPDKVWTVLTMKPMFWKVPPTATSYFDGFRVGFLLNYNDLTPRHWNYGWEGQLSHNGLVRV